jgi:glutathione S-transferase
MPASTVLSGREWLAGAFSVADILMADVLRLVDRFDGWRDSQFRPF